MIVRPCSQAIVALTFSIYASKPFFPECDPPDEAVRSVAGGGAGRRRRRRFRNDYMGTLCYPAIGY